MHLAMACGSKRIIGSGVLLCVVGFISSGCQRQTEQKKEMPPPEVVVSLPLKQEITEYRSYVGHIAAVKSVEIRARVKGFLEKIHFEEGQEVKEGDLLYEIDPRTFEAEVARARGEVKKLEALVEQARSERNRAKALLASNAIAEEEFVQRETALKTAEAAVAQAQAVVTSAQLELGFTKIKAPFAGRIGKTQVDAGNLVGFGEPTLLTNIIQIDPVYVYFQAPEQDYLEYQAMLKADPSLPTAGTKTVPIHVNVGKETDYPHKGTLDFRSNKVDPGTGTIELRGVLENTHRNLTPGLFARVRVPFGKGKGQLLVPETAVLADLRGRYVLTVKDDNTVEYKPVKLGTASKGFVVVLEGLESADRVIINGVQRARPGATVSAVAGRPGSNADRDATPGKALPEPSTTPDKNNSPMAHPPVPPPPGTAPARS